MKKDCLTHLQQLGKFTLRLTSFQTFSEMKFLQRNFVDFGVNDSEEITPRFPRIFGDLIASL